MNHLYQLLGVPSWKCSRSMHIWRTYSIAVFCTDFILHEANSLQLIHTALKTFEDFCHLSVNFVNYNGWHSFPISLWTIESNMLLICCCYNMYTVHKWKMAYHVLQTEILLECLFSWQNWNVNAENCIAVVLYSAIHCKVCSPFWHCRTHSTQLQNTT